jgi:hypothetical protein
MYVRMDGLSKMSDGPRFVNRFETGSLERAMFATGERVNDFSELVIFCAAVRRRSRRARSSGVERDFK